MDTPQWEEFGFWNVPQEPQGYNTNVDDNENKEHMKLRVHKSGRVRNESDTQNLEEGDFSTSSSHSIIYDPQNVSTYHDQDSFRFNRGYSENEWQNNHFYINPAFSYGGIELDMLLFQILDLVHQSEGEGIPAQCIFVNNQLSLERLFEMRTQLGVTYETIGFLESHSEVLKKGIHQQVNLNSIVDGFCVNYLRDLHSRNSNNPRSEKEDKYMDTEHENTEPLPVFKKRCHSDEDMCEDDGDGDYQVDGKMLKSHKEHKKSPNNENSSNRLSKTARAFLRRWLEEHVDHPYPSDEEKKTFAERTDLSMKQINNWFINARRRELPKICGKLKK